MREAVGGGRASWSERAVSRLSYGCAVRTFVKAKLTDTKRLPRNLFQSFVGGIRAVKGKRTNADIRSV